jgi:hypothetical protein
MPVPVMDVGIVGVLVRRHLMPMRVRVRLGIVPCEFMLMPMTLIVPVQMRMFERFVCVLVLVPLSDVQPQAPSVQRHWPSLILVFNGLRLPCKKF